MHSQPDSLSAQQRKAKVLQVFGQEQAISVTINQDNNESISLYLQDYESLLPHRWLRTEALDLVIKILLQQGRQELAKIIAYKGGLSEVDPKCYVKVMDAFVVTMLMMDQQDVVLQTLQPLNLFSSTTKYLIVPINTEYGKGNHWLCGLLVNTNNQFELHIFDSAFSGGHVGKNLCKRLEHLYTLLTKNKTKITMSIVENIQHQSNDYDCGIYTIGFSEYILKEIVESVQDQQKIVLNRLSTHYKYILSNSTRQRYRQLVESLIINGNE